MSTVQSSLPSTPSSSGPVGRPAQASKTNRGVNPLESDRKVYRIAVYGWRDSGKTCLMAALGMPRTPHPDGLTATRVAMQLPSHGATASPQLIPFIHGRAWLDSAIASIQAGGVPDASPNTEPVSFLFEFAAPGEGPWLVELVDFSGELVNPNAKIADLADKLRDKLRNFDALFVLAEHPRSTTTQTALSTQLSKVLEAFTLLQSQKKVEQRFATPVALLFNKWDRAGHCDHPMPEDVRRFLEQPEHRPHLNLRNALANASEKANFETFPVSAFGKSRLAQVAENAQAVDHPIKTDMLESVALEDPFVWACRRRDEIDLQAFEDRVEGRAFWKLWQIFTIPSVMFAGWELKRRFRKKSSQERRVKFARNTAFTAARNVLFTSVALLLIILGAAEYQVDEASVRANQSVLESPEATIDDFQQTMLWYDQYYTSPAWRHVPYSTLKLTKLEARELAAQWRERRESDDWQVVTGTSDPMLRGEIASKFLGTYPTSQYAPQAQGFINDSEELQGTMRRENEAHLETLTVRCTPIFERIAAGDSGSSLLQDIEELEELLQTPVPHLPMHSDLQPKLAALQQKVTELRSMLGENNIVSQTRIALRAGKIDEAIRLVNSVQGDSSRATDLRSEVGTELARMLKSEGTKASSIEERIATAKEIARYCNDSVSTRLLGPINAADLGRVANSLNEEADAELWGRVLAASTKSSKRTYLNAYLDTAPLQRMRGYASDYLTWMDEMDGPMSIRFIAEAYFGDIWDGWNSDFRLDVDGTRLIDAEYLSRSDNSEWEYTFEVNNLRLSDNISIAVSSYYQSAIDSRDNGYGSLSLVAEEFLASQRIDMNRYGNRAWVKIDPSCLPTEPSLPSWQ